ncbi:peroxynitrite isomerase THAP4-like [Rhipicephalus sanguineus]|uniref:peroxynitrite isomerase THAP4-like n=1 Tax=Rhipicephalus sanguineus TaxID=34632 RepID=UPI0020C45256|nr:peroxynitrite isomerase THAP4-like [Rhipicephalus sanguineus]
MAPKFYCVLRNCATKEGDKVVFHHFPSNDGQRQLWTEFVQAVEGSTWRPDKRSQVCSQHFSSDCYMYNMQYCEDFGLKTRRNYLKKGSVPTLYPPGTVFYSASRRCPKTEAAASGNSVDIPKRYSSKSSSPSRVLADGSRDKQSASV